MRGYFASCEVFFRAMSKNVHPHILLIKPLNKWFIIPLLYYFLVFWLLVCLHSRRSIKPGTSDSDRRARAKSITKSITKSVTKSVVRVFSRERLTRFLAERLLQLLRRLASSF